MQPHASKIEAYPTDDFLTEIGNEKGRNRYTLSICLQQAFIRNVGGTPKIPFAKKFLFTVAAGCM